MAAFDCRVLLSAITFQTTLTESLYYYYLICIDYKAIYQFGRVYSKMTDLSIMTWAIDHGWEVFLLFLASG
jgi:hypothetical protein